MAHPDSERIASLDVIRGVAVMGIFSVNVIGFAMIEAAYFNPAAYGGSSGADLWLWATNLVLIDGKMRSLFTMLFGASMLLVIERGEASNCSGTSLHFRRMLVLLGVGLLHYYLLWFGDILFSYALFGLIAVFFRRWSTAGLFTLGILMILVNMASSIMALDLASGAEQTVRHSGARAAQMAAWSGMTPFFWPSAAAIQADLLHHSSFAARWQLMTGDRLTEPFTNALTFGPETLGLMLLGMASYRCGFLTGACRDATYRRVAGVGLIVGAIAFTILAAFIIGDHFSVPALFAGLFVYSVPARILMAFGYAALIILLARSMGPLAQRIAAAGRCAFSNYLGTSLLAGFLFYGWGLGLYGELSRWQAWVLAVPLILLLMLAWSKPWLERCHYGPLEWLWRSLARGRLQTMRRVSLSA